MVILVMVMVALLPLLAWQLHCSCTAFPLLACCPSQEGACLSKALQSCEEKGCCLCRHVEDPDTGGASPWPL